MRAGGAFDEGSTRLPQRATTPTSAGGSPSGRGGWSRCAGPTASIGLASIAVLARLLLPEHFGIVGYAMLVIALLELVSGISDRRRAHPRARCRPRLLQRGMDDERTARDRARGPDARARTPGRGFLSRTGASRRSSMPSRRSLCSRDSKTSAPSNSGSSFVRPRIPVDAAAADRRHPRDDRLRVRAPQLLGAGGRLHPSRCAQGGLELPAPPVPARFAFARIPEISRFSRWMILQNLVAGLSRKLPGFVIGRE